MDSFISAYRRTSYWVDIGDGRICLRVGESNPDLDKILTEHGVREWAYITAYNPASIQLSRHENEQRQARLIRDVEQMGYQILRGEGIGDADDWPPEPSILILGIAMDEAISIGNAYGQTAIVVGRRGESARLLLCGNEQCK
jgi:hypothetical protein